MCGDCAMPTSGEPPDLLVDTSVAVALVLADHDHHDATAAAIGPRRLDLAGHAAFETFSVLSRLPAPSRRTPAAITELLADNFPASRFLSADAARRLLAGFAADGIAGGAVYDALVGAAAVEHGATLATRDRRALGTYRALGVTVDVLDS